MMTLGKLLGKLLRLFSKLFSSPSYLLLFYPESYYCLKCKRLIISTENVIVLKNPRVRVYSKCPMCGAKVTKFISKKKALTLILLF